MLIVTKFTGAEVHLPLFKVLLCMYMMGELLHVQCVHKCSGACFEDDNAALLLMGG